GGGAVGVGEGRAPGSIGRLSNRRALVVRLRALLSDLALGLRFERGAPLVSLDANAIGGGFGGGPRFVRLPPSLLGRPSCRVRLVAEPFRLRLHLVAFGPQSCHLALRVIQNRL